MTNPEVSGLSFHPIKGAAATQAKEVTFTEMGIQHDREWIVCSPEGSFMSQRKEPQLALVKPDVVNGELFVDAPDMSTLVIDLDTEGEEKAIGFFKKDGTGKYQGDEAANWFSEYLQKDAELFRVAKPRIIKQECQVDGASSTIGFADGFPLLIVSEASLAELNTHIMAPIPVDRFRGNIIVSGDELEPYDEDYWREVRIGELTVFIVRACARCPVPNTDQSTGVRSDLSVTAVLKKTRRGIDPINGKVGVFFGQNALHVFEPGVTLSVGDRVTVVEWADVPNIDTIPSK